MAIFVIGDISDAVLCIMLQSICNDLTGKPLDDILIVRGIGIDDQGAVYRQKLRKFTERMANVINILEKVQMICINIQDNADFGEKA